MGRTETEFLSALIFVSDLALKPALNEVWKGYFQPKHLPARATVAVGELGPRVLLEVVLTAAVSDGNADR